MGWPVKTTVRRGFLPTGFHGLRAGVATTVIFERRGGRRE